MPTKETFVAFSFILRAFEGIGAAASITASTAIVAHAFPDNVGTATVSYLFDKLLCLHWTSLCRVYLWTKFFARLIGEQLSRISVA